MPTYQELDENKFHKVKKKNIGLYLLILFLIVVVGIIGVVFVYSASINRPSLNNEPVAFEISSGEGVSSIAQRLYAEDVINSPQLFKGYLILNELQTSLQAGNYVIPANITMVELAEFLQNGRDDVSITFLEGWRAEQFALLASEIFENVNYEEFVLAAKPSEGYLFPDTYVFNKSADTSTILEALFANHQEKVGLIANLTTLNNVNLNIDEVMKIASIVEREVFKESDMRLVAGILINRYRNGELLGADATTQYAMANNACSAFIVALPNTVSNLYSLDDPRNNYDVLACSNESVAQNLDWWPQQIFQADLDLDSPYNTRKNVGLPPTPIANPGVASIDAVINAQFSDFNYYLTDLDGVNHYAKTLDEHNLNVQRYLR